jgi:DNA-binding transcriptional MerR regulator
MALNSKNTNGKNGHLLSAQDISRQFKLAYPTINYYTDLGLLPIVKREGNRRLYSGRQIKERLTRIARMTNEGYPLRLICRKIANRA